jgi:hypothetical protein
MLASPAARRRWRVLAPSLLIALALPATASAQTPAPTETPAPVVEPTATPEPEATPTVSAPDIRPADDPSRTVEDHVEVLGATETSAKLSVSKGCVKTGTVEGSAIRSVAFTLDGRRLPTVRRTTAKLGRVKPGAHKVVAKVRFSDGSTRTLSKRVSGCA